LPINERICVERRLAGTTRSKERDLTEVGVGSLIKRSSLYDSDGLGSILGESCRNDETGSSTSDNYIVV
jgi:hypothetical protein